MAQTDKKDMKNKWIYTAAALMMAVMPANAQLTEEELDRYTNDYGPYESQVEVIDQPVVTDNNNYGNNYRNDNDVRMASSDWAQRVSNGLDRMMQSELLKTTQLGLLVYDMTDQTVVYRHNDHHRMRPASTMKLVTSITGLDMLGGNYQFRTYLYYKGQVDDEGVLHGSLYCAGTMDPTFSADDLTDFANAVRNAGIRRIEGNIVADKSMKDDILTGSGWSWDDDNPKLSALLVDRKDNFAERLFQLLRQRDIVVTGSVTEGRTPQGVTQIALHRTSFDTVLQKMMKDSNNLYAESVFYQIAAGEGKPGTAKKAANAMKRLVGRLGLPSERYSFADGCGLSPYDYVTPELLVRLLRYAAEKPEIYSHLYPVLPIAGVDGTLKSRMKGTRAEGNVRAKTGTVTGVSSLAGYLTASNGHKIIFAIINQGVAKSSDGREFQNKVCEILCR